MTKTTTRKKKEAIINHENLGMYLQCRDENLEDIFPKFLITKNTKIELGKSINTISIELEEQKRYLIHSVEIKKENELIVHCKTLSNERQNLIMSFFLITFRLLELLSLAYYVRDFLVRRKSRYIAAQFIDIYILSWLVICLLLYVFCSSIATWFILVVVIYRLVEITQAYANILVFHRLRHNFLYGQFSIVSSFRTLVIGFISLLEVTGLYGIVYYVYRSNLSGNINSPIDTLYFSAVTITTLGYGDITPLGWIRFIAASESFFGLLFGIALLGRFVGLLPRVETILEKENSN